MAHITPAEFIKRYDARRIGSLVGDDAVKVTPAALLTDENLAAVLDDASGLIDAALLRGARYTPADLAGLTGTALAYLYRLTADLAYGLLVARRGFSESETGQAAPRYLAALRDLDALAEGKWVFPTDAAIAAGKPTRAQIDRRKTLLTAAARRVYGNLATDASEPQPKEPGQ